MTTTPFLEKLRQSTFGLLFMSESDYPFAVIEWDQTVEVTPDDLRQQTVGARPDTVVSKQSVDEFFRVATSTPAWKQGAELETARRYQALVQLLKENLTGLVVYRVGEIEITVYIIGKSESGKWCGLTTKVIET